MTNKKICSHVNNKVLHEIIDEVKAERIKRCSFPHWQNWSNWNNWLNWSNWKNWGNWSN